MSSAVPADASQRARAANGHGAVRARRTRLLRFLVVLLRLLPLLEPLRELYDRQSTHTSVLQRTTGTGTHHAGLQIGRLAVEHIRGLDAVFDDADRAVEEPHQMAAR